MDQGWALTISTCGHTKVTFPVQALRAEGWRNFPQRRRHAHSGCSSHPTQAPPQGTGGALPGRGLPVSTPVRKQPQH